MKTVFLIISVWIGCILLWLGKALSHAVTLPSNSPVSTFASLPSPAMSPLDSANLTNLTLSHQHQLPFKILVMVEPSPFTYVCGYANRFKALLHHLSVTNDNVQIITTDVVANNKPSTFLNFPIHYLFGVRLWPFYPLLSLSLDWKLQILQIIRRMRPDLVHVSSPGTLIIAAIIYTRLFRIPIVASYHTHLPTYVRSYVPQHVSRIVEQLTWWIIYLTHSLVDLTVVSSPQIQTEFAQHGISCEVWQKGVDCSRFHPRFRSIEMKQLMTRGHVNDFLILYVGRLGKEKRLDDLKHIMDRMPAARLCLIGSGPCEQDLKQIFQDNNRVVFAGEMTGENLSQAFASADVFCMPSDSETLGFVVMESLASGVPVVGANAGGIPHIIQNDQTGYLVKTGDIDAFVHCLQILQNNHKLKLEMGQKARKNMEIWSWEKSMHRLRTEQYKVAVRNCHERPELRIWRLLTFQSV